MHQTRAFLIRKYRLSETSLILVWLTQEQGKVKTAARGALKRESPFAGYLDLFSEVELSFSLSKKSDLHLLKEILPIVPQYPIKPGYLTLLSASYFAELCDLCIEPSHPVPELFDLLSRALRFLSEHVPTRVAIEHFEKELAKALGIYDPSSPTLESFHRTGSLLPPSRKKLLEQFPTPV
ncbi:MAG: DNA repair protein RecO [Chthoniobacterales bacterium]